MIRLAVNNAEESLWREIAPRLRGASVEACLDLAQGRPLHGEYDAAIILGRIPPGNVEQLLKAGKHVLLAADAVDLEDHLDMLTAAASQAGVQLAVVNPDRYLPSRQLIRQQLDSGKLGEVGLVRLHRWLPLAEHSPAAGLPQIMLRDFDTACWLAGRGPNLVYAVGQSSHETSPGQYVQVHLGFTGGAMALLDYTDRLPAGDDYQSLSVIASAGAAYADDHQNMQLVYSGGRPRGARADEGVRQRATLAQEFVDALSNRQPVPQVPGWRDILAVAEAVNRSLQSRQAIPREDR